MCIAVYSQKPMAVHYEMMDSLAEVKMTPGLVIICEACTNIVCRNSSLKSPPYLSKTKYLMFALNQEWKTFCIRSQFDIFKLFANTADFRVLIQSKRLENMSLPDLNF